MEAPWAAVGLDRTRSAIVLSAITHDILVVVGKVGELVSPVSVGGSSKIAVGVKRDILRCCWTSKGAS